MAEIHSVNKGLWRSFTSFNLSFYQRDLELLMLLNVMCEFWINLKPQYSQVTLAYFKAPAHPQSAHTGVFFHFCCLIIPLHRTVWAWANCAVRPGQQTPPSFLLTHNLVTYARCHWTRLQPEKEFHQSEYGCASTAFFRVVFGTSANTLRKVLTKC